MRHGCSGKGKMGMWGGESGEGEGIEKYVAKWFWESEGD